ncbi:toprim domain-containing protein [Motilibacter aurantiacus]|uniref:toprim domain-containing protein n=1 Tax=Motilibacter aurantiacus TaxID=2714955 RepID=UPI00140980ED|nr:toprim domain-containing protein [Motilibacter aurantiacus]NHC46746.1 toprim domain-containing protein [Motilibacter aurantiacus]
MTTTQDRLSDLHGAAVRYYRQQLAKPDDDAARARAVLDERGIPAAARTAYEIGYAPPGWTNLTDHLRRTAGATDAELLDAGLGLLTQRQTVVDRFRDRVMLPVRDAGSRHVIAFLGRRMDDRARPDDPKYLNSPDTALWRKGEQLYGFGARGVPAKLAKGAPIAVAEGPLDAIAASYSGPYIGVAPCGTALTAAQAQLLARTAGPLEDRRIVTAWDADAGGRDAAVRAYDLLTAAGAWPYNATLPAGDDPAALRQRLGPNALQAALDDAEPLARVVLDARMEPWRDRLQWAEGRVNAVRSVAPVLAAMPIHRVAGESAYVIQTYSLDAQPLNEAVVEIILRDLDSGGDAAGRATGPGRERHTTGPDVVAAAPAAARTAFPTPLAQTPRPALGPASLGAPPRAPATAHARRR